MAGAALLAKKRALPLGQVYGLLETGPVVLLTTSQDGRANVMTQSWHMMMEFEPPRVACVVSGNNFSFAALRATKECVLNIPAEGLAAAVVGCGNVSARDGVDKFAKFGLTAVAARQVQAPLVAECFASLECRVVGTKLVASDNLFVLEVVQAWVSPGWREARTLHHRGQGRFMIAGETVKLRSKMR